MAEKIKITVEELRKLINTDNVIGNPIETEDKILIPVVRMGVGFGVGENLITAKSDPVFGGVYKLVAVEKDGEIIPKINLSEKELDQFIEAGVKIQCNYGSLAGLYGDTAQQNAENLVSEGIVSLYGTDMHNLHYVKVIGDWFAADNKIAEYPY